jgi:hypothetical protein
MRGPWVIVGVTFAVPPVEHAFGQSQPVLMISEIPAQSMMLSIADIDANAPIRLDWRADVNLTQSYRFELSYDTSRSPEQPNVTLVTLDDTAEAGENTGVVVSGRSVRFEIRPRQIVKMEDLPENAPVDMDDQPERRSIILHVFVPGQEGSMTTSNTAAWTFEIDSRKPPAPRLLALIPGENLIQATWEPPAMPGDVERYQLVYCTDVGTTTTSTTTLPCAEAEQRVDDFGKEMTTGNATKDVRNGVPIAVAVRSIDEFGNPGDLSNVERATPAETTDFWELYKGLGGEEDGGFCFIATAAHGSYAHPVVELLRGFRDRILAGTPLGRLAVLAYYRMSPPAAEDLRRSPELAGYARIALVPIAALALLVTVLPWIGAAALALILLRRRAATVVALVLLASGPAFAETTRDPPAGIFGFGIEFRGGPYVPDLADENGGSEGNTAFYRIFGGEENPLFALAFDLQILRGYGTAGVGASFGFMQWVGKGVFGLTESPSIDTTVLNILPVTGVLFYRFDWLADHHPIPLVPYVRGGLAYYFWWATTGTGDISRYEGADPSPADDQRGRGGKIGVTGTVGLALMLNHLEPSAAHALYANTGIRGTYLFGEIQASKVDGFGGSGFDFSDLTWNLGMYVEL